MQATRTIKYTLSHNVVQMKPSLHVHEIHCSAGKQRPYDPCVLQKSKQFADTVAERECRDLSACLEDTGAVWERTNLETDSERIPEGHETQANKTQGRQHG